MLNKITISRWPMDDCTIGILKFKDFSCFTLELPWKNNKRNVSCIPIGEYDCSKGFSNKNGMVINIEDVHNRDYIQIHKGNYTRNIEGCILVGDSVKFLDGDSIPDVTNSKDTLTKLMSLIGENEKVVIRD